MERLTDAQLTEMLQMQDKLNCMINPSWLSANYPWGRAIRVECAELTDHLGWKWWKAQTPDMAQAQIEVVDIWHFTLSSMLQGSQGSAKHVVDEWHRGIDFPELQQIPLLGKSFCLKGLTMHESVDMLSAFASAGYTFPSLFEKVMTGVGLTWAELRRQYLAKNVLNIFRQRNGYKDGTYIKEWHGREDNVWLADFMAQDPDYTAESLLAKLENAYAEV